MDQTELQQDLQRFVGNFSDRIAQTMAQMLTGTRREVQDTALREALLYLSQALSIATGPDPEVNLLDMVVFVRLCGDAFEEHWIPAVYGEAGKPTLREFRKCEKEIWELAKNVLDEEEQEQLVDLIRAWRAENPEQVRVEGVRLLSFSERAGADAQERTRQARGLLSGVKSATQAADQALLMAERAMFLVHRLPFLVRLQARLGSREMLGDALERLMNGPEAPLEVVPRRIEQLARRSARALVIAGVGLALVWWGGYFISKRRALRG